MRKRRVDVQLDLPNWEIVRTLMGEWQMDRSKAVNRIIAEHDVKRRMLVLLEMRARAAAR